MPSAKSAIDRTPPLRILIRSTNWIGDCVMSMPAVQRIREMDAHAYIALACKGHLHDLWRHNPFINEIIPFGKSLDIDELRERHFDIAMVFPNSFRSAWECWRAGIPNRIGFAGHGRRLLLTDVVKEPREERPVRKKLDVGGKQFEVKHYPKIRHEAHRYLDLAAHIGANRTLIRPKIWLAQQDLAPLQKFLTDMSHPYIGINAGAEFGPAKRWLPERFAAVAKKVTDEIHCRWMIFGGRGDVANAAVIEKEMRAFTSDQEFVVNLAGKTTLLELCALMRFCRLVLTNDTGPMHVASAVGTPVVAIFGSTSAPLTGPLGPNVTIVHEPVECTPCFLRECPIDFRCMQRITVERVTAAVLESWNQLHLRQPPRNRPR